MRAAFMKKYDGEKYSGSNRYYLYDLAYKIFDYLALKTKIAENLVSAYRRGDKENLRLICDAYLHDLEKKTIAVHEANRVAWKRNNKPFGWINLDVRYAGVAARCKSARIEINEYLSDKTARLETLDETRLNQNLNCFIEYSAISSPNLKI